MLAKEKTQIKVGIFVFAGLLLAMYVIFMLGGEKQLFERQYSLVTKFKDISGLRVGAPVQLAGLKVGYVSKITFSTELANKDVELMLKINKKFQDRVRKDSQAAINTQGLLGDKFVFISVGSEAEPILGDGEYLEGKETVSIYNMAEKSGEIMENVREASKSAKRFFEDMYTSKEDVRSVLRSMKSVMNGAEKGESLMHALFFDPKGKDVVADIGASLNMLKDIIGRADEADKKSGEVSGVLKNMREASKGLEEIVDKVNRGEGTIGALVSDPSIYNDIRSLLGRANRSKLLKAVIRSTIEQNDKNVVQ